VCSTSAATTTAATACSRTGATGPLVIEADTSLDAILERQGARRATADEFAEHLGQLPTDGEG